MLVENLLYTLINKGDIETLYKLKDKFFKQNDADYVLFVQDFYSQYNKLPDINTVESKFNISLIPNNEKPAYWYKEVIKKYQEYVIEQAIISSAKQKNNAVDIFQKALIDYNSELDVDVVDYSDAKRRIQSYNTLKLNKGVSYLPTGNDEFDVFSSGYKRADLWTIGGHEGAGKAQPLSEKILGENGWTTIGKLSVGDNIYGSDGQLQKVVEIYPQGVRPIYTVTFADKTSVRCDLEHLWSVEDCNDRSKNRGFKTLTTKELKDSIDSGIKKYYRIPVVNPINYPTKELIIPPYTLGVILGDGSITASDITLTTMDSEILFEVQKTYQTTLRKSQNCGKARSYGILGARNDLRELKLLGTTSKTKFIPPEYFTSSIEQRTELLRGLMDTDGCIVKDGRSAEFISASKELASGVADLVRSLGGIAMESIKYDYCDGNTYYRVNISFYHRTFTNPFKLKRKADKFKPKSKFSNYGKIIRSIEYSGEEEAQCIRVSNPNHLYITKDYIVTHNTWMLLRMASWLDEYMIAQNIKKNILIVSGEMDALELEERLDSIKCGLNYGRLSKGELTTIEERKYKNYLGVFDSNIRIVDSFDNLKDIGHYINVYRPAITFIDGSHLLASSYDWTELAKITAGMKKMTRNSKTPIVNTTHLKADKGRSANGGNIDDFAYTKGYTRDSDIVGVMYASDEMVLQNRIGLDWVKVRRGTRTQIVFENDYTDSSIKVVSNVTGAQLSLTGSSSVGSNFNKASGQSNGMYDDDED